MSTPDQQPTTANSEPLQPELPTNWSQPPGSNGGVVDPKTEAADLTDPAPSAGAAVDPGVPAAIPPASAQAASDPMPQWQQPDAAPASAVGWRQPPGRGQRPDRSWSLQPRTEPRVLVGAIESTAWMPPASAEVRTEEIEQTKSMPILTQPQHFEFANQECAKCGGTIGFDGYCEQCGAKAPNVRDHYAQSPASWVAGLTDRGIRHHRNEDALALDADEEPGSLAICLVCDGVSTSTDSDVASLAAASAAAQVLRQRADQWSGLGSINRPMFDVADVDEDELFDVSEAVLEAIWTASQAVLANTVDTQGNPPSCTLVAGLVRDNHMLVASIGDSRAYWVPDRGEPLQLSVDDSVAQEQMTLGMPREQAESGPHAHVITRWLGHDSPELRPHLTILPPQESAGYLVVCSDGLWNYASDPESLASVVREAVKAHDEDLPAACQELVDWANDQGGHDNISVSLARVAAKAAPAETDQYDVATTRVRPQR